MLEWVISTKFCESYLQRLTLISRRLIPLLIILTYYTTSFLREEQLNDKLPFKSTV